MTVLNNFYWFPNIGLDSSVVYHLLCMEKERLVVRVKNNTSHVECIFIEDSDVERDLRNKDIYVFLCVRLLLNISFKARDSLAVELNEQNVVQVTLGQ